MNYRNIVAALAVLLLVTACDYFVSPQARVEKAEALMAKGNHRGALIELKNALQSEPDLAKARLLLAEVALWLGDASSAEKELGKVPATTDPVRQVDLKARIDLALARPKPLLDRLASDDAHIEPARLALYRGQALLALNRAPEAEQQFRDAAKADPGLIAAQAGMVDALVAQNNVDEAFKTSSAMVAAHPDSALAWYAHGVLFARKRDTAQAVDAFKRARDLAPTQLDVMRQLGVLSALTETQLAGGQVEDAKVTSEALKKLAPGSGLAMLMSSRVLMASNEFVAAAAQLRQLVNAMPNFSQGRFLLGVALLAQGNVQQAAQELTQVVTQSPENLEARQLLAQVRMRLDDPDGALQVLVPALQASTDVTQLSAMTDAVRAQADSPEAIKLLEQALQETPDNEALQLQLSSAYLQAGATDKAIALLRKGAAGSKDPRRAGTLLQAIEKAQGRPAARAEADSLVAANPSDVGIIGTVAIFYARSGDFAASRQLLNKALAAKPEQPQLLFTLAQVEWSSRQIEPAANALQKALKIDPQFGVARLALAELELSRNKAEAATEHLELLRNGGPQAGQARLLLARLALAQKDAKRADLLIDEMIKAEPSRSELRNLAGTLYLNSGRFDQAMAQFHDGTAIDPGNPMLWLNLGRAQLALGQNGPAHESLEQTLKLRPNWVPAVGALAFMEVQSGDTAGALRRLDDLKQQRPRDPAVAALDGEVQTLLRRYKEAAQAYGQAYELQPSGLMASKIYEARVAGQLPEATRPLEQWLQRDPNDLVMRLLLADAYNKAGQHAQAVQQYQSILAAKPEHVASLNNLAWVLHQMKDPRALDTARKAYELAPNVPAIADTFGWILVETGRVDEGVIILKAAASHANSAPEISYHYAAALARSGAAAEARSELEKLLRDTSPFPSRAAAQQLQTELSQRPASG